MSRAGSLPPIRRMSGFTLLELLVVLTIVAAVLALIPLVSERGAKNAQVDAITRIIVADLRWLRHTSIRTQQETNMEIDAARGRYARSADATYRSLPEGMEIEHKPLVAMPAEKERGVISFYPDGTSSGGEIALRTSSQSVLIRVAWPFGRIELDRRRE